MNVRLLAEAEVEAQDAARWYEARRTGLGEDFLQALSRGLEAIESHPTRYSRVANVLPDRDVRRILLKRFPYKIVFEIRPSETLVIAVAHTHRHPTYWKHRGED